MTEPTSEFDFYDTTPDVIQTTREQPVEPVVMEMEDDCADKIPMYEVGESAEHNNLTPSRPRRYLGPLSFYYEKLYVDVIEEQATGTAVNPSTLSEDTARNNIYETRTSAEKLWLPNQSNSQVPSFHKLRLK